MAQVKKVSPFQWACYDHLAKIPVGQVTTYGAIAKALNSSARAVGSAMRNNPFAPEVPCHRVIAANLTLGGYGGHKEPGPVLQRKIDILRSEGVQFSSDGKLKWTSKALWQG